MLSRFRIILCGPRIPGNIGSVARAAANFGVRELFLVSPACNWKSPEAQVRAVATAGRILHEARIVASLEDALKDVQVAVGFTRRGGRSRDPELFHQVLPELAEPLRIALVFGNEETGLTDQELRLCTIASELSTDPALPSMNLSHAVAVVLARLHEEFSGSSNGKTRQPKAALADMSDLEGLLAQWREILSDVGLTTAGNPERMIGRFREIFHRAALLPQDVKLFRGFLSKTKRALRLARSRPSELSR
ncbi:MAG: hypothetical protein A2X94_04080 [Bdellovibrionales bacterium GWB1_55_8]|nr:MAG: hypothetical protein A2X94_04080 [Bdellovibrionales bacterium GWB1_55_8]